MHPSIVPISQIFGVSTALYEKALAGLDRETLLKRPGTGSNPLLWIAGHLASSRYGLAGVLGRPREFPLGKIFSRGAAPGDLSALPEIGPIQEAWRDISALLMSRLEELTDAEIGAPSPRSFPNSGRHHSRRHHFLGLPRGLPRRPDGLPAEVARLSRPGGRPASAAQRSPGRSPTPWCPGRHRAPLGELTVGETPPRYRVSSTFRTPDSGTLAKL